MDKSQFGWGNKILQNIIQVSKDQAGQNFQIIPNDKPNLQKQQFHVNDDTSPSKEQEEVKKKQKRQESFNKVQNEGYGSNAHIKKRQPNQFQSQSEVMREEDLMRAQKKKLQIDYKDTKYKIQDIEEGLLYFRKQYKSEEEKQFQLGLQKIRIQNLRRLIIKEDKRLQRKMVMSQEDKQQIFKEIKRIYEMQIRLIQRQEYKILEKIEDETIAHIFEKYLPLYTSLQSSDDTKEKQLKYQLKSLSTVQKYSKLFAQINAQKQKRNQILIQIQINKRKVQQFETGKQKKDQILNWLDEKKVQWFELQLQFKDTKNEDKKKIEIKLFKLLLNIQNFQNQLKEFQNKDKQATIENERLLKQIGFKQNQTYKSALQIEWENIEKKKLRVQQTYEEYKQDAMDKRQKSLSHLEECIYFGNNIQFTNGIKKKSTCFFKDYNSTHYYSQQLNQIIQFLDKRQKLSQNIQIQEKRLKRYKQNQQIVENQFKQVEARIYKLIQEKNYKYLLKAKQAPFLATITEKK